MNTVKKVWGVISTVIVVLAVLLAVLLVGTRLIGLQPFTVLSGSMEPTFKTGSLIYVRKVDPETLEAGDIITYVLDERLTVATHRIVEVIPDGMTLDREGNVVAIDTTPVTDASGNVISEVKREYHIRFRTKGDANDNVDGTPVLDSNVVGSPLFSIPYLGFVANYIQNPPGTYVAISAGAILLLLVFLPDLLFDDKEKDKNKKKKKDEPAAEIPGADAHIPEIPDADTDIASMPAPESTAAPCDGETNTPASEHDNNTDNS